MHGQRETGDKGAGEFIYLHYRRLGEADGEEPLPHSDSTRATRRYVNGKSRYSGGGRVRAGTLHAEIRKSERATLGVGRGAADPGGGVEETVSWADGTGRHCAARDGGGLDSGQEDSAAPRRTAQYGASLLLLLRCCCSPRFPSLACAAARVYSGGGLLSVPKTGRRFRGGARRGFTRCDHGSRFRFYSAFLAPPSIEFNSCHCRWVYFDSPSQLLHQALACAWLVLSCKEGWMDGRETQTELQVPGGGLCKGRAARGRIGR